MNEIKGAFLQEKEREIQIRASANNLPDMMESLTEVEFATDGATARGREAEATGGIWADAGRGGPGAELVPPVEDEARITAAAALGVLRLLSGTKGV